MNFFERQDVARRQSRRLVWMFALAVVGIVVAVEAAVFLVLHRPGESAAALAGPLLMAAVLTLAVIGLASLYRVASLRQGGAHVARQLGGVEIGGDGGDPDYRRLRNVVEEIAIASGVPVPAIFVLEHEPGINAFAAGYAPSDAAVAVTRGALDALNRDELQGVIAHEFSHILNGDMRLNIRMMGVLFGIFVIALIGRKVLIYGRGGRDARSAAALLVAALVAMVVGYLGLVLGRLIKAAVSRQREFLADASAVQFTRQTRGIAGALKKIGGLPSGSRLADRADGEEVSHMLFGEGLGFSGLFATHPPLVERIRALEPDFREEDLQALAARWRAAPPRGLDEDVALGLAPAAGSAASTRADARELSERVAAPGERDYERAGALGASVPGFLHAAAHDYGGAMTLVLALLLARDDAARRRQLTVVEARYGRAAVAEIGRFRADVERLDPALRLPLAAMAFPRLRRRPRPQLELFVETVRTLSDADGLIDLFEYCLAQMLRVQVVEALDPGRHWRPGRRRLDQVREPALCLLAVLAHAGHADEAAARRAFNAGVAALFADGTAVAYEPPCGGPQVLDAAWPALDALDPLAKARLVEALAQAVGHDGRVGVAEAELLRATCAVLHCPLPAILGDD
ncbi:M48 family metallopeptidase [Coralloluteibacterium stylophorae]|uniref:M48 family metallopeptidase n=1 Tax=Coralloluteibacterium stylophorae TaxID=1776034 RepID=A0A8J7VUR0_9GAMM|nr:M48 family metallopeptidase [Coralloluteibacterium stylophorae]MBS7456061.1 M48 family metallopeptidase [Coralloluteibacterium stylophorae]